MATEIDGSNYSEVDASNNNAAPNGMPEGMPPSGVNDAWRQGMGAIKRAFDRDHAGSWCTVGGTANALTLTYTTGPLSYIQGQKFAFKATAPNTAATTVNVSGLGAKNVFRKGAAGPVALTGNEIQTGDLVELEYDGTQFQILSYIGPRSITLRFTRAHDAVNATVGYTGFGFKPSYARIEATINGDGSVVSIGNVGTDGAGTCTRLNGSTWQSSPVAYLISEDGDATSVAATWASWDADGLSLAYVRTGSTASKTVQLTITCFR